MDKHVFKNERDLMVYMEQCINAPELEKLVQQFHDHIPEFNNIRDRVKWLADFSSVWDFRARQKKEQDISAKENARWLIQNDSLSTEQEEVVCRKFGDKSGKSEAYFSTSGKRKASHYIQINRTVLENG